MSSRMDAHILIAPLPIDAAGYRHSFSRKESGGYIVADLSIFLQDLVDFALRPIGEPDRSLVCWLPSSHWIKYGLVKDQPPGVFLFRQDLNNVREYFSFIRVVQVYWFCFHMRALLPNLEIAKKNEQEMAAYLLYFLSDIIF